MQPEVDRWRCQPPSGGRIDTSPKFPLRPTHGGQRGQPLGEFLGLVVLGWWAGQEKSRSLETGSELLFTAHFLVAGAGFEPATFGL